MDTHALEDVFVQIILNVYPTPITLPVAAALTHILNRYNIVLDNVCTPTGYVLDNTPFELTERGACDIMATVLSSASTPYSTGSGAWYGEYHSLYNELHDTDTFNKMVQAALGRLRLQPCIKDLIDSWA